MRVTPSAGRPRLLTSLALPPHPSSGLEVLGSPPHHCGLTFPFPALLRLLTASGLAPPPAQRPGTHGVLEFPSAPTFPAVCPAFGSFFLNILVLLEDKTLKAKKPPCPVVSLMEGLWAPEH